MRLHTTRLPINILDSLPESRPPLLSTTGVRTRYSINSSEPCKTSTRVGHSYGSPAARFCCTENISPSAIQDILKGGIRHISLWSFLHTTRFLNLVRWLVRVVAVTVLNGTCIMASHYGHVGFSHVMPRDFCLPRNPGIFYQMEMQILTSVNCLLFCLDVCNILFLGLRHTILHFI